MVALTADRNTPAYAQRGIPLSYPVKGGVKIFAGALVVLAAGFAKPGASAAGLVTVGRADDFVDNSAGGDGDQMVRVRTGIHRWDNSAAADLIAASDVGSDCFVVDDQTVAKTSNTNARSPAGKIINVDANGVWVASGPGGIV